MIHTDGKRTIANAPSRKRKRSPLQGRSLPDSMLLSQSVTPAERRAMSRHIAKRIVREYR